MPTFPWTGLVLQSTLSDVGVTVGLIGCGNWGKNIVRDLVSLGARVHVVARSPASAARAFLAGALEIHPRLEDLPSALHGLVVATPNETHVQVLDQALELGVPVFVEKPMTTRASEASRLAGKGAGRLFSMDKWRYHPGVEEIARLASVGGLGRLLGLQSTRVAWGEFHSSNDVVWHLSPHELAIAYEVMGRVPEPRSAVIERMDGAAVGMRALLGRDPWFAFEVSNRTPDRKREVRAFFEDGVAVLQDAYAEALLVYPGRGHEQRPTPERRLLSRELPLLRELRAFVEHLRGSGPPPRSSADEAARMIAAIERLHVLAGEGA